MTREEWNALTPDKQWESFYWRNWEAEIIEEVIAEIPECPLHGPGCLSGARAWIREAKAQMQYDEDNRQKLRELSERLMELCR